MTSPYANAAWRRAATTARHRDGHQCTNCHTPHDLTVDHIIPLADGGHPTDLANLTTLCRPCHAHKTAADQIIRARRNPRGMRPVT